MMGSRMHYVGWLSLAVPEVKNEATAAAAKEVLSKVTGVEKVVAYPAQRSLAVRFASDGSVTSRALIDALAEAGFKASNY